MLAARMKMDAKPWVATPVATGTSAMPTSMAMMASTPCEAIRMGRLSVVPPSMQMRPPDDAGREEAGEGARRIDGVPHTHVAKPGPPEHHRNAALEVDGRDQQRRGQVVEGAIGHQLVAEGPQRRLEVDGAREHAFHEHAHVVDAEQVASAEPRGPLHEALGGQARCRGGGDHGADARAGVERGPDGRLVERAEGPDVGQALDGAAAEHEADARQRPGHGAGAIGCVDVHAAVMWCCRLPVMRILFVEDDDTLRESATTYLRSAGFAVDPAPTGKMARALAAVSPYDAVVLDVRLPDDDGFALCTAFRARRPAPRILMATARDGVDDRIAGLDLGADDYLVKPYSLGELVARLRALLRRPNADAETVLRVADLVLDPATRVARRGNREITLTTKEYAVLEVLMRASGRVLTRTYISEHAWDDNYDPLSNVIDVYVARLRRKVDQDGELPLLETVRGAGYRIAAPRAAE